MAQGNGMEQQSLEERVAFIESKIAEYEAERAQARESAELRADVRKVSKIVTQLSERTAAHERYVQARFGVVEYDLNSLDSNVKALQTGQQEIKDGMRELHSGQQEVAAGQQQILELLLGKTKRND